MQDIFVLWDLESRSIVGEFATEAEALAAVRGAAQIHGRSYAETFAIVHDDMSGETDPATVAMGADLVDLALAAETADAVSKSFG